MILRSLCTITKSTVIATAFCPNARSNSAVSHIKSAEMKNGGMKICRGGYE